MKVTRVTSNPAITGDKGTTTVIVYAFPSYPAILKNGGQLPPACHDIYNRLGQASTLDEVKAFKQKAKDTLNWGHIYFGFWDETTNAWYTAIDPKGNLRQAETPAN